MKYNVMRSYTVVECQEVEATDADAAIQLVEDGFNDYFVGSYDGDYDRDDNHQIIYTVDEKEIDP
tara:strand:+ start:2990 stop:3184 length:195 start_codon:yes stop_codon:yes gene_type:complete